MAGNAEDAEDWAQECLVHVYRQLGRYDALRPFTPWLLRVVSNTCINLAKSRSRRQEKLELGLDEESEAISLAPDPLRTTLSAEEGRQVRAAVRLLPPLLRQAVVLRVLEELSFRELANALGVPLQTAASRVRRGLLQIRERLERAEMATDRFGLHKTADAGCISLVDEPTGVSRQRPTKENPNELSKPIAPCRGF